MRMRKPRGRSEQPSLQPLLQLAQGNENHEDEVDMGDAEFLIDDSHAASDQYDAQQNSTAPSTKSEESPEMESGKEVAVRSVNPFLQGQDGGEHLTSMANSLEVHGDIGMEKQGEGSEELTGLAMSSAIAIGAGASNLHAMLIEESESDSELPSWLRPSSAPEGSLLHTLYLQLVDAGRDGITVQELFKCLKKLAEVLSFGAGWKLQVQWHLKTNPHFCEANGYYYLLRNDQLEVQQPKRSPANIASTSRRCGASLNKTILYSQHSTPATMQPGLSVDAHEDIPGVVQNRWTAFQKAIEFEEMHQSMADMQMPSSVADPTDSQLVSHRPFWMSSRKRKSPSTDDEELPHHGHPIPGGLQASQAGISAKTEVQTGQRCVVQKNDTGNSRCNMMALAGLNLCNHHCSLQLQEDGRTSLSPNPKYLIGSEPWIAQVEGVQTRVQCGHGHKSKDGTRSLQCSRIARNDHRLCEDHKQLREERKACQRADAQQGKRDATSLQHGQDSSILSLPESHTNVDQSSLSLHPKSAAIPPRISGEDTLSRTKAAMDVDKRAAAVSNHDEDSDGEQLQQRIPKSVPKRHHVSARKTAANVGPLKSQGLIRTPIIPPLPSLYGIRRKTPVKNRDH